MISFENIGLLIGYCFMVIALSLMCWSFTGLFTNKIWKRTLIFLIIIVASLFIMLKIDPSTETFNFKAFNGY